MNDFSIIDYVDNGVQTSFFHCTEKALTPLRVALGGRVVTFSPEGDAVIEKPHHVGVRILAALGALLILPVTLTALAIK